MKLRTLSVVACAAVNLLGAASAFAEDPPAKVADKSQYTLVTPTPKDQLRAFNPDRPTKVTVPYTVDAGHFQYEADLFIYGYDNTSTPDTQLQLWTIGNPTLKLGILDNVDVEVNFSMYNSVRATTVSTGASSIVHSFGDTFTKIKWNMFGNEGGGPAMALVPYAKWPTAPTFPNGVGNGFVEWGLIAPIAFPLPADVTFVLQGEMDFLKNSFNDFYRVNIPLIANISRPILENVTAYAEFFANFSTDHRVQNIYTADFALAWQPWPNFQIDAGINVGLDAAAIPYQFYVGIAQRF
jgi:hypothetical protein